MRGEIFFFLFLFYFFQFFSRYFFRCRHEVFRRDQSEATETICVCKEGFTGDPDSTEGCYENGLKPISSLGCLVNNETYSVGQKWNDGCDYTCTCSEKLEILCQVNKNILILKITALLIIIDFLLHFTSMINDLSQNSQNCLDFICSTYIMFEN